MFNDPIFDRYKWEVWPFMWPIFVLAILAFRRDAKVLFAAGCLDIEYEVTPLGLIRIVAARTPNATAGWKDALFAATGAYGEEAARPDRVLPVDVSPLPYDFADPGAAGHNLIQSHNWVVMPRALRSRSATRDTQIFAALPLPDT